MRFCFVLLAILKEKLQCFQQLYGNDWSIANLPLFQEEIMVLLTVEKPYI